MALSDSMFLLEIVIKSLKSNTCLKNIKIIGQFANVFRLHLKGPSVMPYSRKLRTNKIKLNNRKILKKSESKIKSRNTGQSILITGKLSELLSLMKIYPLEIILSRDKNLYHSFGSTIIPWSKEFINYLNKDIKLLPPPAYCEGKYKVYDKLTSNNIASINISLKLTNITRSRFMLFNNNRLMNIRKYEVINDASVIDVSVKSTVSVYNKQILEFGLCTKMNPSKSQHVHSKSDSDIMKNHNRNFVSIIPHPLLNYKLKNNLFRYIFGDLKGPFGNKVYQVNYFTVDTDVSGSLKRDQNKDNLPEERTVDGDVSTLPKSAQNVDKLTEGRNKLKFKKCDSKCSHKGTSSCPDSVCSSDLPEAADLTHASKCNNVTCDSKNYRELTPKPDDRILLDITNSNCCAEKLEKVEEVIGGVIATMKIGHDPCFCTCKCGLFCFSKKTTYCTVCGGYEQAGDDIINKAAHEAPMPCPVFHKLVDKNKFKTLSTSGSESRRRGDDQKSNKGSTSQKVTADKRSTASEKKSVESDKGKKKKKDDRFKFNYGYKAPQIGHSKCALPCTGTLDNVPKRMGWLWTAENIPGMKFRPSWQPGAINKHVLRLLRMARNPGQIISKKKRKDTGKKKRPLKRPLIVVHKKDGEYTVTMETMKTYTKARALNQQPYEDKPLLSYTIGRTEEENRDRLKKKEREQRRQERAQRNFIQSAFRDMCHEICLKTYQQALGILPNAEDPECICNPALPSAKDTNMDLSCSCSDDKSSGVDSDTDSDEWFVEFTPPIATFDPNYKGKKVLKADNGSQYSYLDYRVKLVDRFGNPIPRFFKGPDGKQQCSDLGGFWSPEKKWLEINVDGYIAPDEKWAPMNFIGPNGEQVDAETGKFQATNGRWLVVGIDGFVDSQGKWKFYPKAMESIKKRYGSTTKGGKGKTEEKVLLKPAQKYEGWSCFGDVTPKQLSELGIVGHGEDRKLLLIKLQKLLEGGEDIRVPKPSTVFHLPFTKGRKGRNRVPFSRRYQDRYKCHHPVASDKGIVAVDDRGNKTYFRLRDYNNRRPKDRMTILTKQGISLSSFHVPCFHSFINSEVMKQQQRDRIIALSMKNVATSA